MNSDPRAVRAFLRAIGEGVTPDAKVWTDEWSEDNRILPADTPEPGPFRNARTPYLIDIQRTMSPGSSWREGWWMKPHQVGGSVTGENLIGSWICNAAGSILVVFPTLDDGDQWEQARFEPMRKGTRELRKRIRPPGEKGSGNTRRRKRFPGGVMRLIGANRTGGMKSSTIRYIKFEEPDEYARATGNQGSLINIIKARTSNFGRKAKIFGDGTPTVEGASNIADEVARGDQRRWFMHCPDCGHAQTLVWEQLRWVDGDPDSARYVCKECGGLNDEATWKGANYRPRPRGMDEAQARASGRAYWEATATGEPGVASWVGFNALGAPLGWRPWPALVREWIAAQGDAERLQVFFNNNLALPFADRLSSAVNAERLQERAEAYELMTLPYGGLVVTAGVDTQDNRLAVVFRGWGRGEQSWGIWHSEIHGDPSAPETWAKLRELLEAPIRHESGQIIRVDAAAIDAGGHHGEDVYAFCKDAQLRGRHWFAIRGAKAYDAPKLGRPKKIEFNWRGQPVPGGAELRWVGTQAIKTVIDGRLRLGQPGGGFYHFPRGFQPDYYQQLRAEKRVWRKDQRGNKALWWECPRGVRNEAWDCEVYAYAAFLYVMSGRHADAVWDGREKAYGRVRQLDLLDDGAPKPQPSAQVQASAQHEAPSAVDEQAGQPAQASLIEDVRPAALQPLPPAKRPPPPPRPKRGFGQRWG